MLQAQRIFNAESIDQLLAELNMRPRSITEYGNSSRKTSARSRPSHTPAVARVDKPRTQVHNWPSHPRIKDIAFDASKASHQHPAYGKRFVFTGELTECSREQAQRMVLEAGGKCTSTVSKATDFLVQGTPTWSKLTSKAQRAFALRDAGTGIELIDETSFLELFREVEEAR